MKPTRKAQHLPALGAHVSVAGGVAEGVRRGTELACDALQIFVKSPSQWQSKPLAPEDALAFREAHAASAIGPVVAHAAYLINLAAPDPQILAKSRAALADELRRCAALGVAALVVHPGAHLGAGEEAGLAAIARSLDAVEAELGDCPTRILLEITAGQGTVLGSKLAHLASIRAQAESRERLGICLDTCHALASGYAIDSAAGWDDFLAELDTVVGFDLVGCIHLNDSVGACGSRKDRHANLGEGCLGLEPFRRLLAEPRLRHAPMILETPIGDDELGHARDLAILRGLQ
ncbi:MAG: deoxyribonuclease IV [Thermoanaerobaculia bacterium]